MPERTQAHHPLVPFKGYLRDRGVGVSAVVDRLDNELHPLCSNGSNVDFLTIHAIGEGQIARGAVGEVSG